MLAYGHFTSIGPSHMTGTFSRDAIEEDWWLAWAGFALPHGHNVLLGQWQNYPAGENFGVNGSMLALGVAFMPITKLFGPVVTWNIALRLGVAISAISMCLVLRRWTTWWPAAFVGGLIYGFSAYMAYYGGNYLFLVFVPLPPVIFLLLYEIVVRQQWSPRKTGALLGVLCALQFFIWSEVLAGTVVMGLAAVVLFLLVNHHLSTQQRSYARTALAYGLGVAGLLLIFPLLYTLAGPQSIKGSPVSATTLTKFPSDLLGALVPRSQWLGTARLTALAGNWYVSSEALYLGIPMVVALVSFAIFFRRRRMILFAGTLALIAFVLSLGPRLWIDGHETLVPLPFLVLEHLPIAGGFVPVRFSLYTALFAGAMFAMGLDELWARMRRSRRPVWLTPRGRFVVAAGTLAVVSAAVLIPLVPRHTQPTTETNVPSLFTSAAVEAIPAQSVVLAYPYPDLSGGLFFAPPYDILLDQAVADMRFKLIGGYGWFPSAKGGHAVASPSVLKPESVQEIFDAAFHGNGSPQTSPLSEKNIGALREFLREHNVQTVIALSKGAYPGVVTTYVTAAIGQPVDVDGVTAWFRVKQRLERRDHQVDLTCVEIAGCQAALKLETTVVAPPNGATVSGTVGLDAKASGYFRVTKVEFYLTDGSGDARLISAARLTPYGWIGRWNTSNVANGRYTLRSRASNTDGLSETSAGVTVTVSN